ncbi:C-type lectin domain family 4 member C-like isoform X2 [Paramisgurnus dabryanus]|uniref:C-type lectin domain family 4 member C-like isoform X2 n=1 Tax=Paramisgurnus dabryanus TaxID=90735 RepID=UPI0031F424BC
MGEIIYDNVVSTESEGMNRERIEMMVDIYDCADSVREPDFKTETNTHQQHQRTVIVLCVLINTNNYQFNIKTKNLTEERDQLLTNNTNLTKERDDLIAKYKNITKLNEHLNQEKCKLWTQLYDGWIYYQSSLYFISSEQKTWTESRSYCRERGADLTIINNKEEQDFIKNNYGNDKLWIGLTDIDEEGRWKWVDNSTLISKFWGPGEPNGKTEDCVLSHKSGWADYPCTSPFKWICERAL